MNADDGVIILLNQTEYKVGTVTYKVTAHFSSERDTLKSKIFSLLGEAVHKDAARIIAENKLSR